MKKLKTILSAGIALYIGATSVLPVFAAENLTYYKIGDFDANKKVDVSDVTTLQMQLAGYDVMEVGALDMADFNGDGKFDVNDITDAQRMVAGLDYDCFMFADESYLDIECVWNTKSDSEEYREIEFEQVYYGNNKIFENLYADETEYERYLVKSKEEFYSIFNVYFPAFDDEFFEEYALYVMLEYDNHYGDEYYASKIGVDSNQLCVDEDSYHYTIVGAMGVCWHNFYKVKQEDVKDIETIAITSTSHYVNNDPNVY